MEIEEPKQQQSIPVEIRWQVIGGHRLNASNKELAKEFQISESSISRIITKWRVNGEVKNYSKSGRPSTVNEDKMEEIIVAMSEGEVTSANILRSKLSFECSRQMITRILHELDYEFKKKQKVVYLTDISKSKRLKHCKEYLNNNLDGIVFTDESYFREFNYTEYCWTSSNEVAKNEFQSKDKFGSVMLFGAISKEGKSKLWILPEKSQITAEVYQTILSDVIVPFVRKIYGYGTRREKQWYFQQDNAAAHCAKSTKQWFDENKFNLFPHPPCSPDLNPIEMVWAIMKHKLSLGNNRLKREDLIQKLHQIWDELDQQLIVQMIDHTKKIYQEVISNHGDYVKKIKNNESQ
ncbi:hypothetical protein ABPG72_021789 [Tetrahymena utriculariae]